MRVLDFSDGYTSASAPSGGTVPILDYLDFNQGGVSGNPAASDYRLHVTSAGKLQLRNSAGTDFNVGGGGGVSFRWYLPDYQSEQDIFGMIKVPDSYVAGTQILLRGGLFATTATTGDVLFQVTASLIEPGSTVLDTYSNQHTSTNTTVTVSGTGSEITAIGDCDLSSSGGAINSVSIAAGDLILVKLTRATSSETSSAAADARLLRNSFEVIS